jgi:hypothetical protein
MLGDESLREGARRVGHSRIGNKGRKCRVHAQARKGNITAKTRRFLRETLGSVAPCWE